MIDNTALIGFLSGSLMTILIKEVINQINKKQDFDRKIKKITYTRKLEKAENAVAFYWTGLARVTEIKKSFEVIVTAINELNDKGNDLQVVQEILNKNGQALSELSIQKFYEINSVHLYFDLDDKGNWNEDDTGILIKSIAETKSIDNDIKFWIELYDNYKNQQDFQRAEQCWNKAIEILPTYVSHIQKVIEIYEKNKNASLSVINALKKQIKKI